MNSSLDFEDFKKKVNKQDGSFVSHYFFRKMSNCITFLIYKLKVDISPESIVILSLFITLIGSGVLLINSYTALIIGVILIFLANLLDAVDGEVARIMNKCSSSGAFLDEATDRLRNYIMFFCLGLRLYLQTDSVFIWILIFFAAMSNTLIANFGVLTNLVNKSLNQELKPISHKPIWRRLLQYGDDANFVILLVSGLMNQLLGGVILIAILSNVFVLGNCFYQYFRFRRIENKKI